LRPATAGQSAEGARRLVAYIVARKGTEPPSADDLRRFVSERLPAFMVPSLFVPVDMLPTLSNGKVDRGALASDMPTIGARTPAGPLNPVEAQLIRIWDDLMDLRVGRDDNFFELGGHSLLVPRLIDRVQRDFGVALPIGTVFETPTIKGLAEIIQSGNRKQTWRSLVAIRERGVRPPLYMVHGLGGEISYFYNLAEYLDREQPVFGLQAPVEPFGEIEAMASHYLEEIRGHQPHGPYRLGGYCMGGSVAFEMARQLVEAGESVSLLAVIDTVMPAPHSFTRRLKRFASKSPREMLAMLRSRARTLATRRKQDPTSAPDDFLSAYGAPRAFYDTAVKHFRAQSIFRPRPYKGDMWLFRSEHNAFDQDLGWRPFVQGTIQIRPIPGRHSEVLKEPNLKETARQLSAVLDAMALPGG
jgi:thioesterase domain-containing protein